MTHFWTGIPSNSAGDIVLHGNYPHSNLFEQNICQNIIFDNSHGLNGPHNTLLRNRAESFGIFFTAENSPSQNMIGNEIPNTDSPFVLFNYTIQGSDHFIYGNNDKGNIDPPGTEILLDSSYAFLEKPLYIPQDQWAGIGTPNVLDEISIPARDRQQTEDIFSGVCGNIASGLEELENSISVYPNPTTNALHIQGMENLHFQYRIIDQLGQLKLDGTCNGNAINISALENGTYILMINSSLGSFYELIVKN